MAISLVAACSGSSDKPTAGPAGKVTTALDGCDALDLPPPAAGEGIQVSVDMQLEAGQERQVCKLVLAGDDVNMNWTEGMFTRGAHHANVLSTAYTDALPTQDIAGNAIDASQAADCESLASLYQIHGLIAARVSAAKSTLAKGVLPDDVALKIAHNDVLELNLHMINTSDKPVHACYKENLYSIPADRVKQQAGVMFWYNSFITLPANGQSTATMACPVSQDVNLVQQVSHMHKRAVNYTATLLDGDPLGGANELEELYRTTNWGEPQDKVDTPPLAMKSGQWIKWSCDYENQEARNVAQGQQTSDEMCMFIGMYYPQSSAMDWCMASDSPIPYMAGRPLTTGTQDGAQFSDCWGKSKQMAGLVGGGAADSADRYATQKCVTDSCPNVSARVNELLRGTLDISTVTCDGKPDGGS